MNKKLKEIQAMPDVINNTHESCYKAYHILAHVKVMIERGDSKETIFEVADFLNEYPLSTTTKKTKQR